MRAILAILLFASSAFAQQFTGMAVTRLDSGQTWYASASLTVDRPYRDEWFWSLRTKPEADFWTRDIDLMEMQTAKRPTRIVDISLADGILTMKIANWGTVKFVPIDAAGLEQYITPEKERTVLVIRDKDGGTVSLFVAHRIWGAVF